MISLSPISRLLSFKSQLCRHHLLKISSYFFLAIILVTLGYALFPQALTVSQTSCSFYLLRLHAENLLGARSGFHLVMQLGFLLRSPRDMVQLGTWP